ncbi:MAG: exodeoxyribonuclease VII small subunit [Pseudomonadota bacterium]|jgi:exodeoxyribonuclease VII small subunit
MGKAKGDQGPGKSVSLDDIMKGDVTPDGIAQLTFEEALMLLEGVVAAVESGSLPLDQAIGSYERGTLLVQHLRGLLSGAEEKLRLLSEVKAG